jgi:Ca2+-transporting ATPase
MRAFREIVPEDAEVLRDTRWTRYDATALVKGDIIRFVEGDIVPADCILLSIPQESPEVLVDTRAVTGESKPRSIEASGDVCPPANLFYGSRILQGSGVAVVIAIGPSTVLASLIRQKKFPAKAEILEPGMDDDISRIGISLVPLADGVV